MQRRQNVLAAGIKRLGAIENLEDCVVRIGQGLTQPHTLNQKTAAFLAIFFLLQRGERFQLASGKQGIQSDAFGRIFTRRIFPLPS
jgi:hypothetical protein